MLLLLYSYTLVIIIIKTIKYIYKYINLQNYEITTLLNDKHRNIKKFKMEKL